MGLYDPRNEHDACGVGLVARLDNEPTHEVVQKAIRAVENLEHRGASGADLTTGDGAGILIQMPDELFRGVVDFELPPRGRYGVLVCFLPVEDGARQRVEELLERTVRAEGQSLLGWRDVPVRPEHTGRVAGECRPVIRQLFIGASEGLDQDAFERKLYVIRRVSELASEAPEEPALYVASSSSRTVNYKGMLISFQLAEFYPDLRDERIKSAVALVHSRFSTNTFPSWELAHPYRLICHNGEFNTLMGNVNWMRARESELASELFGEDLAKLLPVVPPGNSDSATFDNVLELLTLAGRSLPHAVMMMIPEAYRNRADLSEDIKGFYDYHSCLMEPWDGPAVVAFTDGRVAGATLDRNGLRPGRWVQTRDGHVVLGSEIGLLDIPPRDIVRLGRLQPGKLFLVDLEEGRIVEDGELKQRLATRKPYRDWYASHAVNFSELERSDQVTLSSQPLHKRRLAFGYSQEDIRVLLTPMARDGEEPVGSMGNDLALAMLSDQAPPLFSYFKQLFAQVTNPPIDSIREEIVMSVATMVGTERNLLDDGPEHAHQLVLDRPVLLNWELETLRHVAHDVFAARTIDTTWGVERGVEGMSEALARICSQAQDAIEHGVNIIILSDRLLSPTRAPIPSLLAVSCVHHHLVRAGTRLRCGIILESGEPREVHHFATLIGYGASAINPYVMLETLDELAWAKQIPRKSATGVAAGAKSNEQGNGALRTPAEGAARPEPFLNPPEASANVVKALCKGLLKTISKMGISTIQSYTGAQIFEAVGLERELIDKLLHRHRLARRRRRDRRARDRGARAPRARLPAQRVRPREQRDLGQRRDVRERPACRRHLRMAARRRAAHLEPRDDRAHAARRARGKRRCAARRSPATVMHTRLCARAPRMRSSASTRVPSTRKRRATRRCVGCSSCAPMRASRSRSRQVEPASEIVKRFCTGAMSLGSISREAHETLAIAMNRLHGKSNTGEGGEDPVRFTPDQNGDRRRSAIKQVASGRFGVTIHYLVNADELQIKMAQGAKPGEGGQLPGHKVDKYIGWIRHTTPGVGLISPPPHHDIYSIEDLKQLIYDLRCSNPRAQVSVKLVAEVGVGTVAAGVSKANADRVLISGHDGGTGASPLSSIQAAGVPWEIGLAETQQTLLLNDLRSRIFVQTDGQLKSGRDVVIAALLGADEMGFSTAPLIAAGCIMMRACHLNTCPVGIATQDPELRKRFAGTPEHIVNFFFFLAEEVREILASLGLELARRSDRPRRPARAGRCDRALEGARGRPHAHPHEHRAARVDASPPHASASARARGRDRLAARRARPPAVGRRRGRPRRGAAPRPRRPSHRALREHQRTRQPAHANPQRQPLRRRHPLQLHRPRPRRRRPPAGLDRSHLRRLRRPELRRLARPRRHLHALRRRERLHRQGPLRRRARGAPPRGHARGVPRRAQRHRRQHRPLRGDRAARRSSADSRVSASECATPAPRRSSRASATTAVST